MNGNNVRWGKKYFVLGRLEQPRQDKNLLYRHDKPNQTIEEKPLSFVLFESSFTSVSTVAGATHPALVSLFQTLNMQDWTKLFSMSLYSNVYLHDGQWMRESFLHTNSIQLSTYVVIHRDNENAMHRGGPKVRLRSKDLRFNTPKTKEVLFECRFIGTKKWRTIRYCPPLFRLNLLYVSQHRSLAVIFFGQKKASSHSMVFTRKCGWDLAEWLEHR